MGGYGSGRWRRHTPKTRVEDCKWLDIDRLRRRGQLFDPALGTSLPGEVIWGDDADGWSLRYRVGRLDNTNLVCQLLYVIGGIHVELSADIDLVAAPLGGQRWHWRCPSVVNDQACGRRVRKLYLPPARLHFGCRHCHDLTYRSCVESHRWDRLYSRIGDSMGIDGSTVEHFLKERFQNPAGSVLLLK